MSRHTVRFYDGGEEGLAEVADALSIERTQDNALRVKLNVVAGNFDECSFEDTMTPSGPNEWRWSEAEMYPDCVVVLTQTESEIVITSNWDCKDEFCGHRATLEGTFPLASQRPLGSYVWPER